MSNKKTKPTIVDSIPETDLPAWRRSQFFETGLLIIQIILMIILAFALITFLVFVILAGVTQNVLPDTEGVRALSKLFSEITLNAKSVALILIGFFFRDYLNAKDLKK